MTGAQSVSHRHTEVAYDAQHDIFQGVALILILEAIHHFAEDDGLNIG